MPKIAQSNYTTTLWLTFSRQMSSFGNKIVSTTLLSSEKKSLENKYKFFEQRVTLKKFELKKKRVKKTIELKCDSHANYSKTKSKFIIPSVLLQFGFSVDMKV